jgi:pimeloyl-ACP methyl ester carboxylesterase
MTDLVTSLPQYANVGGSYELATTFCEPDSGPTTAVQLLTHGIGFDRSYWDFPYHNYNYSYVYAAVDQAGYSTLSWDRLGTGASSHGHDPINEIQASLEVAAMYALTQKLRAGEIPGVCTKFSKVIHVGHSFGSAQTYTLAQQWPKASDGIVLTGFTQVASFAALFFTGSSFVVANSLPPFAAYPVGYIAPRDQSGTQNDFFAPNAFDPNILPAANAAGQPLGIGEALTVVAGAALPSSFAGPVLVISGGMYYT